MKKLFSFIAIALQFSFVYSQTVKTLAGADAPGYIDSLSVKARFNHPNGLTSDDSGNVYVADKKNHRIRKIDASGRVTTIAGNSEGNKVGKSLFAKFSSPSDVVLDSKGNIFVSDTNNNSIKVIRTNGMVEIFAGSEKGESGAVDGKSKEARFLVPEGLAVDANDNLYVADKLNHRIRKIDTKGIVSTLAGKLMGNVDGLKVNAKFYNPVAVAVDLNGNIYVADSGNNKIRKVSKEGFVSTFAGSSMGYVDGQGNVSKFKSPTGVAVDKAGNLYVSDYGNNIIRKITPSGYVSTVAGNLTPGAKDGYASSATFMNPSGISVNSKGDLIIADYQNHKVRKLINNNSSPVNLEVDNESSKNLSAN